MKEFLEFLKSSRAFLKNGPLRSEKVHFTLGNESCDLDSSIASLMLGYFLSKKSIANIVIPVLNVSREGFLLRTENCFVLNQAQVPLTDLVFRNEVNFQEIISNNRVTVSLVDHHVLSKNDKILEPFVTEIFDHRPVDSSHQWNPNNVHIKIEQVGSCCTLIAGRILEDDTNLLTKPLAYLLYQTIIYDTIAVKPEKHKATPYDIEIATKLEEKYYFLEDRQLLFDKLWAAHNDVSHLTPKQLLNKDLKTVEGIYVPGLPMLVEEYLNLEGSMEAIEDFAKEHNVTCILLVGLDASKGNIRRDLAVYSITCDDKLKKALSEALLTNPEQDFMFEERKTKYSDKVLLLHVHNIKISRKQIIPIVKSAWNKFICESGNKM